MSDDVTRSMDATSAVSAAYVARHRKALPSGVWAIALVICSEATIFGTVIASYFYLRFQAVHWPPPGIERPSMVLPLLLTSILVMTTIPMYLARRASLRGSVRTCAWLILVALVVQSGFFAMQMHLFLHDLHKIKPSGSAYGSAYFTLLGLHQAHVAVGLAINAWLITRIVGGFTNYRLTAVRVAGWYWYFVNAMAVAVVLTQLYPSL
jgi:cytochrome c oxidase subunit 3